MALWTPPGADLGELDGPTPDSRMVHFIGGIDANGQPLPMTYQRLRAHAEKWVITEATPDGPAHLLEASRDMFTLGFYSYELVACAASWSIFAVEAALKVRLQAGQNTTLQKLVQRGVDQGLVDAHLADILDTGRQIRNDFVHEGKQPTWSFGMADQVMSTSFKIVAELFPATS